MSETLSLTALVYGSDCVVVGPRFLDRPECVELRRRCERLLALEGVDALSALDLAIVEEVAADVGLATEEDMKVVVDLYEMREREAALRGEVWEGVADCGLRNADCGLGELRVKGGMGL